MQQAAATDCTSTASATPTITIRCEEATCKRQMQPSKVELMVPQVKRLVRSLSSIAQDYGKGTFVREEGATGLTSAAGATRNDLQIAMYETHREGATDRNSMAGANGLEEGAIDGEEGTIVNAAGTIDFEVA